MHDGLCLPLRDWRRAMRTGLLLALVMAYAYWPLTHAGFVYEDRRWIAGANQVPPLAIMRPLMHWSWWAQAGSRPQAFHAVNLGLHLTVAVLVGMLSCRLGLSQIAAWFAGSLWALHPLTSEGFGYLAARPELFAAVGVLGACLFVAGRWRWWTGLAVYGALAVGIAGKETAAMGLLLISLVLWAQNYRRLSAVAACIGVVALALGVHLMGGWLIVINIGGAGGIDVDWWPWLTLQSTAAVRLIGQAFLPLTLTVDYDYDLTAQWVRLASLTALCALVGLAWQQRQRRPLVTFGLTWTLLTLLPRLIVQTPRGYLNEHQWYTPLIGLLIASVSLWDEWRARVTA